MKKLPNKKEAWKKAARILYYWRDKHQVILQDLGDKIEASMYLSMGDYEDDEKLCLADRVARSKYFESFERDIFGEYALFNFPYGGSKTRV